MADHGTDLRKGMSWIRGLWGWVNSQIPLAAYLWQYLAMSQNFGIEIPKAHAAVLHRKPVRYLVVIDAGGSMVARLFLDTREMVSEFDAAVAEVASMTTGLAPTLGALGSEWDIALQSHSVDERARAEIYTLKI
jgi:hypothetical protein